MAVPKLAMIPSGYKAGKLYSILPTDGTGDFTVSRNSTATRVNSAGLIETVGVNVPRLDYPTIGGCPELLVEPQSTNLYLNSAVLVTQNITTNIADSYTISFYGTGTITFSGAHVGSLVGSGANIRVFKTFRAISTTLISTVSGSVLKAQAENLDKLTSYIQTNGISVTRNSDVISVNLLSGVNTITETVGGFDFDIMASTPYNISGDRVEKLIMSQKDNFNDVYGIKYNISTAAPEVTRTGNLSLHASLPIQSLMKRCVLNDAGIVSYYLHDDNSALKSDGTPADLTGADGQVMVEIPSYYRKFQTIGNWIFVDFSLYSFSGSHIVPKKFISAYKATVNRTNNKLSSVVNLSVDYRGGNNNATLDANPNTQLGKPASLISRTNFNLYAQNRGANWRDMRYHVRKDIFWLITAEYATRNHQTAVNNTLTAQGFKQGCLGEGPTNLSGGDWSTFNDYYPVYPCGSTNSLGNKTGEVAIILQDFPTAGLTRATQANSYRGIENFFGDIWEWTNGVNVKVNNNLAEVFVSNDNTVSDTLYTNYHKVGEMPFKEGYIKSIIFGAEGDILPLNTTGGSSTTYFSDYYYQSNPASEVLRGLLFGGIADSGAGAGSAYANSSGVPSSTTAYIGSRLCFFA